MSEHLELPYAGEFSLGFQWKCPVCGEQLRSEKSARTNWQTWYFTADERRHYKTRCNLKEKWCGCGDELQTDEDIKTGKCGICRSLE